MLLKVGINKKGINSNVDTYVFNETFLSSDVEMIQKKSWTICIVNSRRIWRNTIISVWYKLYFKDRVYGGDKSFYMFEKRF